MRYKIEYQKDQKFHTVMLEANDLKELQTLKEYPSNILVIKEMIPLWSRVENIFAGRNSKKLVFELFSQLDLMLGANLSFHESIDLLLHSKQDKNIENILHKINSAISSSMSIEKALKEYENYLGKSVLLFLQLGFENGNIKQAVHSLVEILEEDIQSREKLQEVMRYPLILIASLCISVGMIFIYVLPNFDFLFELLEGDIPFSTQLLLSIKEIFAQYGVWIVIILSTLWLVFLFVVKKYQEFFDKVILLYCPIVRIVIQNYYYYRLFLSISIIVQSKYQFQLAIENSKNIVKNLYVQKQINTLLLTIKNGASIAEAFEKSELFDPLTIKLLYTAEYTNGYEKILSDIATQYKKRFQKSLKTFSATIEPFLILVISIIVLWLILAIMLPIWNLGTVMR